MTAGGRVRLTTRRGGPSGAAATTAGGIGGQDEVPGGERDRADRRDAVDHEGDVHGPVVAVLLAELPGAVERVDDPDPARAEADRVVGRLLREDRVVGTGRVQRIEDEDVGLGVALGAQGRGVVARRAELEEQLTGVVRDLGGELVVVGHRRWRASGSATIFSIFAGSLPDARSASVTCSSTVRRLARAAIQTSTTRAAGPG